MSGSVNRVTLIGNLGKDPDVRRSNGGKQIVSFSLAMSESWRDKQSGERKEKTEWVTVMIFNENIGKIAEQYCKKGSKVYLEGKLRTRKWQDKEGADRYTTEVVLENFNGQLVLLDGKRDGDSGGGDRGERSSSSDRQGSSRTGSKPAANEIDEDIPF